MADLHETRRPYNFAVREGRPDLYATHVKMNRAAGAVLDWLLTVRGGLSAVRVEMEDRSARFIAMRMLVRCWFVPETGVEKHWVPTVDRVREILVSDGVPPAMQAEWLEIAGPLLRAPIAESAGWVDRRARYDRMSNAWTLSQEAIDDIFGGDAAPLLTYDNAHGDKAIKLASAWISKRLGSGEGSDYALLAKQYVRVAHAADTFATMPTGEALAQRAGFTELLAAFPHKGRASSTILSLQTLAEGTLTKEKWETFATRARKDAAAALRKPEKGQSAHSNAFAAIVEAQLGFPFRGTRDHLAEYSCAMDLGARRFWQQHSGIARAEEARVKQDAEIQQALAALDPLALGWITRYRARRGVELGSPDVTLTSRTIRGWEDVHAAWQACVTPAERIEAVARLQAGEGVTERIGDPALFRALAEVDAEPVRRDVRMLRAYVAIDQEQRKAVAVATIDPFRSPVWVEYGVSRLKLKRVDDGYELETFVDKGVGAVRVRPKNARFLRELALHGTTDAQKVNVPRADTLAALTVAQPATEEQQIVNGRLVVDRESLISLASMEEEERVVAGAALRWQLTYSAKLRKRAIDEDLIDGLRRNKGTKGELGLSGIPGLRVLGVDRGTRHGVTLAVVEAMSTEEVCARFPDVAKEAKSAKTLRLRPNGPDGRALRVKRIGGPQCKAPWALLEQTWHLRLPGESRDERSWATPEALGYLREVERLLEIDLGMSAKRIDAIEVLAIAAKVLHRVVRSNGDLLRAMTGIRAGGSARGEALLGLRNTLKVARHGEQFAVEQKHAFAGVLHVTQTDEEIAILANRESESLQAAEHAANLWLKRDERIRKALGHLRRYCRVMRGHRFGGLSLEKYWALDAYHRLQLAYLNRPTPECPEGPKRHEGQALRIQKALERVATERVRLMAHGIVAAALGGARDGSPTPKQRVHAPCAVVAIEDLSGMRSTRGRTRYRNKQIRVMAPQKMAQILQDMCDLHGLKIAEVSAAYTSRRDAFFNEPGIVASKRSVWHVVRRGDHFRSALEKRVAAEVRSRYDVRNKVYTDGRGRAWHEGGAVVPTVLMPEECGAHFVTQRGIYDADFNAAMNIALEPVTDASWEGAWMDVPVDERGRTRPDARKQRPIVQIESDGRPTRAFRTADGIWVSQREYWITQEEQMILRLAS